MSWYKVTKKINGRLYDYWQRTKRVGKTMKTENRYIGPARSTASVMAPISDAKWSTPEEARYEFRTPYPTLRAKERREDEAIQYGKLKDRITRQAAQVRAAKKATKGIKNLNPFIAQALKK